MIAIYIGLDELAELMDGWTHHWSVRLAVSDVWPVGRSDVHLVRRPAGPTRSRSSTDGRLWELLIAAGESCQS